VRPFVTFHFVFRKDPLMFKRLLPRHLTWIVLGLTSIVSACGDDTDSNDDAGARDGGISGKGGKGGSGGKGGTGGKGGAGGASGGNGGKGGAGGAGGAGGSTATMECTEEAPPSGFQCGGETCTVPEFANNPCVVPCCIEVDGKSKCGAKSTSEMFPAACALPAVADDQCPPVSGGMGGEMAGCCNYDLGKCGIISTARPGCITMSTFVEIPDKTCSKPATNTGDDAGVGPDAG
jgi:hypothetical protein